MSLSSKFGSKCSPKKNVYCVYKTQEDFSTLGRITGNEQPPAHLSIMTEQIKGESITNKKYKKDPIQTMTHTAIWTNLKSITLKEKGRVHKSTRCTREDKIELWHRNENMAASLRMTPTLRARGACGIAICYRYLVPSNGYKEKKNRPNS